MKKLFILALFTLTLIFAAPSSAHFGGIAALKVDGKFTVVYPLQNVATNIGDMYLPSDEAPGKYLANKPVSFEIDLARLPYPDEVIKQIKFNWDFGDGSKSEGVKVFHTFKKIGSHTVTLTMNFGDLTPFGISPDSLQQGPQTTLIHIVPYTSYQLPHAVITIDNKKITDPARDVFTTSFKYKLGPITLNKSFAFNASASQSKSAPIASYLWDFGDDYTSTKADLNHSYAEEYFIREPVLRVVDSNGFISDTYATMSKDEKSTLASDQKITLPVLIPIGAVVIVMLLLGIIVIRKRSKN